MNIDLHTHVKLSKKSPFMPDYFAVMMKQAKENGLQALALTEHFNTLRFMDVYDYLNSTFPYEAGYYQVDGLKLFSGMEVDIAENGHILIVSERDTIIELWGRLEPHLEKESFLPFEQLLELTEGEHILRIGAHPFRTGTPLAQLDRRLLGRLDALDLNGKDLFKQGTINCRANVEELAKELGLPVTAGSDTHHHLQYGCVKNVLHDGCETVRELKASIKAGRYAIDISPELEDKVRAAAQSKKLLKKQLLNIDEPDEFAG